jgi:transposase InsO family protein
MKRTLLQKIQYLIQERDHERAMREVLQLIKPSAYTNNRKLMTEAAKLRDTYSTHAICDALQIKRSTFLNHIFRSKGENSVYAIRDRQLSEEIKRIFEENDSILGAAKIAAIIRQNGTPVTEKKVHKLMRAMGLKSVRSTSKQIFLQQQPRFPNLVKGNFNPTAPNMVWVSDVTEFKFKEHRYFICVILDLYSRKAIAHRISMRNSTHLVLLTLRAACKERSSPQDTIFHSDRGSPYTSMSVRKFCREHGMNVSYSHPHTPTDNPVMEAFFSSLKQEKLYRCNSQSVAAFYKAIDDYVAYYNSKRQHQTLGFLTPNAKEAALANGGSKS